MALLLPGPAFPSSTSSTALPVAVSHVVCVSPARQLRVASNSSSEVEPVTARVVWALSEDSKEFFRPVSDDAEPCPRPMCPGQAHKTSKKLRCSATTSNLQTQQQSHSRNIYPVHFHHPN